MVAYRPDIDGLRAIAIVSVVAFHANSGILPGGFTGVDIFFVISGYLISQIIVKHLEAGQFTFTNFWMRRARRILPALLFTLIGVTAVSLCVLLPDDLNQYGQLLSHTVFFAANIFLSHEPGYFEPDSMGSPLLHLWSLAVEEQYYLLWPLLLTTGISKMRRCHVLSGIVALFCTSLAFSEWASLYEPGQAFYSLPSRIFEFLIGAALAVSSIGRPQSAFTARGMSAAGVLLISVGFIFIDEQVTFPGLVALVPCAGTALLLASGEGASKTPVKTLLSSSAFVRVGKISYSWYLWHWPPLAFARYYFERPLTVAEMGIALAIGLGMGVISWRFVETPFRRPTSFPQFRQSFLPGAVAASAVMLAAGMAFQSFAGLPGRMDPATQAMLKRFDADYALGCNDRSKAQGYLSQCTFGAVGSQPPSIMLWGDSHAGHYLPVIAKIAAAQGATGISRIASDCRPLIDPAAIERLSARRRACPEYNEQTLGMLKERPEISTVVLAAHWSQHEIALPETSWVATFEANLERTIAELEKMGKKVVILGQVPRRASSLKSCMTKQVRFGHKIPECEAMSFSSVEKYQVETWMATAELSRTRPEVAVFLPQNILCDRFFCRATDDNGLPLYKDDDHLTAHGAYFLEPYISDATGPLFGRAQSRAALKPDKAL